MLLRSTPDITQPTSRKIIFALLGSLMLEPACTKEPVREGCERKSPDWGYLAPIGRALRENAQTPEGVMAKINEQMAFGKKINIDFSTLTKEELDRYRGIVGRVGWLNSDIKEQLENNLINEKQANELYQEVNKLLFSITGNLDEIKVIEGKREEMEVNLRAQTLEYWIGKLEKKAVLDDVEYGPWINSESAIKLRALPAEEAAKLLIDMDFGGPVDQAEKDCLPYEDATKKLNDRITKYERKVSE